MISLSELARQIDPARTILFLGAGSSVPSGGPTAAELAETLQQSLSPNREISKDLADVASILVLRHSRDKVVELVREKLRDLAPTRGLLVLPEFQWYTIYTTNFDILIERAYAQTGHSLVPVCSNYDYGQLQNADGVPLFKIHGCITQDVVDGHKARLVLTDEDYDEYRSYREILFGRLRTDLSWRDVLVIGYSLGDKHLSDLMKEASLLHSRAGAPGRLYALLYERDEDRAMLMEQRGFEIAFGGIDDFMNILAERTPTVPVSPMLMREDGFLLPIELRAGTVDVSAERFREPNVVKLFNGAPAKYSDITAGSTFRRSCEHVMRSAIEADTLVVTLLGVAGVGKSTVARRIALSVADTGWMVWEHHGDFPLRPQAWLKAEATLRENGTRGLLLIDNSPSFQRYVNMLVDGLAALPSSSLQLLIVGERSRWAPTAKTPNIFARGVSVELEHLDNGEIERIVTLAEQPGIRDLVSPQFARLPRPTRVRNIRRQCEGDMFVSLKHMFGTEGLDIILLREFADLPDELQAIYRTVAALEAAGTRVHRQLIIRLLGIPAQVLRGQLAILEGLVDEYTIDESSGLYGWRTRHEIIAEIITRYKFSDQSEFYYLLRHVIENLNPTISLEMRTLIDLCNTEYGIRRISDIEVRTELYNRLIELAPGERVPRHRLIHELLEMGHLDEAEHAVRTAIEEVGTDPPLHRYKTLIFAFRAKQTVGIMREDRLAMLKIAWNLAQEGLRMYPNNKYSFSLFEEIAVIWNEVLNDPERLREAATILKDGFSITLDPSLSNRLRRLETRLGSRPAT